MATGDRRRGQFPRSRRTLAVVLAVTAVGLVARVVLLGSRVAHWDEARVAYWTLDAARTGVFEYRAIIHGPLLQHVDRLLFAVAGPTDFAIRFPVAVVGGLLPLAALLLRDRLDDRELAGVAVLLAFDPTLLYYSRFMRSDVLVAAFCFLTFGLAVRAVDTGRRRYLVVAGVAFGLAVASKENVIAYLACWLGALVVPLDHRLVLSGAGVDATDRGRLAIIRGALRDAAAGLARAAPAIPFAVAAFLAVVVWAYAPRNPAPGAVSLGNALGDPSLWPAVVERATVGSARKAGDLWVGMGVEAGGSYGYPVYFGSLLKTLGLASAATVLLGIGGFLADRYSGAPRALPAFAFAWAAASLVGYPAITDIPAPWLAVHLVLPLTIPGGVALARLWEWMAARAQVDDGLAPGVPVGDRLRAARVPIAVLLLVALQLGGVGAYTSFVAPAGASNELAQYGQPAGPMRPALDRMEATAAETDGPDVLLYGPFLVDDGPADAPRQPGCAQWFDALPLPWYTVRAEAAVTCAADPAALPADLPPVVIANATEVDAALRSNLTAAGYEGRTYLMRQSDTPVTVYFGPDAAGGAAGDAPATGNASRVAAGAPLAVARAKPQR